MTTYELYINGLLCDIDAEETIALRYQSPIFSELDSIQSNRSYNISLPLTPRNLQAVEHSQRVDVMTNVPYIRLSAALYMNGVPLFTKGYAVVTDISETINVTLTWGNVDNFQPLFDNNLRDLGKEMEYLGADHIDWNASSTILDANTQNEYPGVAFWGINFGMGLGNPKYIHPSVQAMTILEAIEKQHGIIIDGKERLAYSPNLGPIVPLVGKNGDEVSGKAEVNTCQIGLKYIEGYSQYIQGLNPTYPDVVSEEIFDVKGANYIELRPNGVSFKVHGNSWALGYRELGTFEIHCRPAYDLDIDLGSVQFSIVYSGNENNNYRGQAEITLTSPFIIDQNEEVEYESVVFVLSSDKGFAWDGSGYINTFQFIASPREKVTYPSVFPVAPNLPDMSQGDFILALMNMNGLFAYADKDEPDMIRLISIDDITDKAKTGDIVDWSDKVILNDFNRVDMPDASEFTIDELAQSNILDYDNDDDVETDTHGIIKIDNENIEKETELVTLPFSASDNGTTDGVSCAIVPIYTQQDDGGVSYSECSDRILSGRGAIINGLVKCIGVFDPWMKFGGEEGLVETKYSSYRKVVSRVRLISVRVKLSAVDLYNLDYTKPVYISQFGQLFAIYSVETGDDGICTCELLMLNYRKQYYIHLDGQNADYSEQVNSQPHTLVIPVRSNGSISISDVSSNSIDANISEDMTNITVIVQQNRSNQQRIFNITMNVNEDPNVNRNIKITQLGQSIKP